VMRWDEKEEHNEQMEIASLQMRLNKSRCKVQSGCRVRNRENYKTLKLQKRRKIRIKSKQTIRPLFLSFDSPFSSVNVRTLFVSKNHNIS
jgi:hypothetical protein